MMIRNKKFWIAALLCLAAILGALGCGSKKDLAEPEISNITADVSERPSGIYLGDYVFSAAELDGRVLTQEEYVVRNKYFLFACEEYGAFGVGEHAAAISFEGREEPFRFTLTVTDTAPCRFEFPEVIGRKFEAESFSLALAERKSAYQTFDISYRVETFTGEVVRSAQNLEKEADDWELVGLEEDEYIYAVDFLRGENLIDSYRREFSVTESEDLAKADVVWRAGSCISLVREGETLTAVKTAADSYLAISAASANSALCLPVSVWNAAMRTDIANMLCLRYFTTEEFDLTFAEISASGTYNGREKTGILSSVRTKAGEWTELKIPLPEEIGGNEFGLLLHMGVGQSFLLREVYVEPIKVDTNLLSEFGSSLVTVMNDAICRVVQSADGIEIHKLADAGGLSARHNAVSFQSAVFQTYRHAGFAAVRLKYSSDAAFAASGGNVRLYGKAHTGWDVGVIQEGTTGVSPLAVLNIAERAGELLFSFEDFYGLENHALLGMVVSGTEGVFRIDDIEFLTQDEYDAILTEKLSQKDFARSLTGWTAINESAVTGLTAQNGEVRILKKIAGTVLTGRDHAVVLDGNLFAEAKRLGFTKLHFSYRGDENFAGSVCPKLRFYGKKSISRDVGAVQNGTDGLSLFSPSLDLTVTSEWQSAEIDLAVFLALENHNALGIVVGGDAGASVCFKEVKFIGNDN